MKRPSSYCAPYKRKYTRYFAPSRYPTFSKSELAFPRRAKCPDSKTLGNVRPHAIGGSVGRVGEQLSRAGPSVKALLTGSAQSRERLHRASLSGSAGRKVAARATRKRPDSRALSNVGPQAVGGSAGRAGEQLSRAGPSVKALLTGIAQSHERLHRASLSASPRRKVAGARNAKVP
jgi:hypothetical protein